MRFCGDCVKFRTQDCERVWSIGLTAEGKDGNRYWLQNPRDYARSCDSYNEVKNPKYLINHENEQRSESLKYGGNIVWQSRCMA